MKATDLKEGDVFKRNGVGDFKTVQSIRDLDKAPDKTVLMRNKLEINCTNGTSFWIYKNDRVTIKEQDNDTIS